MTTDPVEIPSDILEWMKRSALMHKQTRDELVQQLWNYTQDGQAFLYFVMQGQISWKADQPRWHKLPLGELSPDTYDPPGSGPRRIDLAFKTVREYGCRVAIDPIKHTDIEGSKKAILTRLRDAQVIADAVSFVSQRPVRLRVARRMNTVWTSDPGPVITLDPPSGSTEFLHAFDTDPERTGTVIEDKWIDEHLCRFLGLVTSVPDPHVRRTLEDAISWHAQANSLQSLGRYVHYWASIELLASFFYEYLDPGYIKRPTAAEVDLSITQKLLNLNGDNYRSIVSDCAKLLNPSARDKILALANLVQPTDSDLRRTLYAVDHVNGKPVGKSMYDIRNDIAHGNVSTLMREYVETHADKLEIFQRVSGEFIVAAINRARDLCLHKRPNYEARPSSTDTTDT